MTDNNPVATYGYDMSFRYMYALWNVHINPINIYTISYTYVCNINI